jgi:L-ascorbate oxidase
MVRGSIWNPWTLGNDPVELRSFRGTGTKDGDFVAPTIRVKAGQTLRIHLDNRLPPCTAEERKTEYCRNDTNLHTHGLWVSPAGNSDNVMISIPPGGSFDYEFRIPDDHPAGTFWYHPHRHGSGAFQVGSGMGGALIVEGDRLPTLDRPGDVDVLLKDAGGRPFPERVLAFRIIPYACSYDADGWPRFARDGKGKRVGPTICEPGEVGRIERASQFLAPPAGATNGRYFSINGKVQPLLGGFVAGRFERWRIVHAGTFGLVRLHLKKQAPSAPDLPTVPASDQPQWIERYCTGPNLSIWQIAHDGLTRSEIRRTDETAVPAGGRLDLLTWFPEPGRYCMLQVQASLERPDQKTLSVRSVVEVAGRPSRLADPESELRRQLLLAARHALPGSSNAAVRSKVIADLENGLRLDAFVPHRPISDSELTGQRAVEFRSVRAEEEINGEFLADGRKFNHDRIDHSLPLGGVEQWRISVPLKGGGHVFHIHVNPFQIVSIRNAKDEDALDPSSPGFNPIYAGLSGQWLDTVALPPGTSIVTRTRYERFIGDTMLHCHVVLHSDLGMMQHVRIHLPESVEDKHVHH